MAAVTAELHEGTRTQVQARQFTWFGDEPAAASGSDVGPTPYELLLGGLASCVAITLRLYADHKQIDLEMVRVELDFDRVHSDDCEECDERLDGYIERIRSNVTIRGQFDAAQRSRLEQVARRCPVHKTMANGTEIFDSVSFEPSI